ncbi:hypothetical protein K501DRAFT_278386 [Backusella circina FSU 941]|nr:hypothetical protein K501DRAFT_278386 [Backusella circina FSU 941]
MILALVLEETISEAKIDIDPVEEPQTEQYFDDEEESDSDSDSEEDKSGPEKDLSSSDIRALTSAATMLLQSTSINQHVTANHFKSCLYGSREINNNCLQYIANLINRTLPVVLNAGDKGATFITCRYVRNLKNIILKKVSNNTRFHQQPYILKNTADHMKKMLCIELLLVYTACSQKIIMYIRLSTTRE